MPSGHPLTKEQIQYIVRHFPDTRNDELTKKFGICKETLYRVANRYKLRKTEAHRTAVARESGLASAKSRGGECIKLTPEMIAKRSASYQRTRKKEKALVLFGLPQETKMKVKVQPKTKVRHRSYLKSRGYILDEKEVVAYYTPETNRCYRMEASRKSGKQNYYYRFEPLPEKDAK